MRFFIIPIIITILFSKSFGQSLPVRQMDSKLIGKDSVVIYYDMHYKIIESDCASMIRYGHYDITNGHFIGKFRDVSKKDTSFVISEGSYSDNGLKNGEFIIHYLNGALQAKGSFKDDKYDGDWVFYYSNGNLMEKSRFKDGQYSGKREVYNEDGSPRIFMKIEGDNSEITDAWDNERKKIVDKGNGVFTFFDGSLTWRGKLVNGVADSIWRFQVSNDVYGREIFKKGQFIKGDNQNRWGSNSYEDKSRIKFSPKDDILKLALLNSDHFTEQNISCDGTDYYNYHKWKTIFLKRQ